MDGEANSEWANGQSKSLGESWLTPRLPTPLARVACNVCADRGYVRLRPTGFVVLIVEYWFHRATAMNLDSTIPLQGLNPASLPLAMQENTRLHLTESSNRFQELLGTLVLRVADNSKLDFGRYTTKAD